MDYKLISQSELFQGIDENEIKELLHCLGAVKRTYQKGEFIYSAGEPIPAMGMVLSGNVQIEQTDFWGDTTIFGNAGPGQIFGETYACLPKEPSMVDVIASKESEVLLLQAEKVLYTCPSSCTFHNRLIHNLLSVLASKNLTLSRKITHISPKSIRERMMSYLSFQAICHGNREFDIPFNRQQLAGYLNVDRSALSHELSKMQQDGLISFKQNHFILY